MIDPTTSAILKGAVTTGQALAKKKRLIAKLLSQPDAAASQLAAALAEFRRSVEAVRDVLLRLLFLSDRTVTDPDLRDSLVRIRDGQLLSDVAAAKGRCSIIGRIYDVYLDGWISRVIGPKQAIDFKYIFNELRTGDDQVTRALEELSREASQVSAHVIELIEQQKHTNAISELRRFAALYQPRIRELNKLVAYLLGQENKFLDRGNIV